MITLIALLAPSTRAQGTYTWNVTNGNWDTTTANWTGAGTTWVNGAGSDAVFLSPSGLITLTEDISAHSLTFQTSAYTLRTLTAKTLTLSGASAFIETNFAASASVSINVALAGTDGLTKTGSGKLVVDAPATYSGATTISAGILQTATGDNRLPVGTDLTIASGARLSIGAGRSQELASISGAGDVTVFNAGTLVIGNGNGATFPGTIDTNTGETMSLVKNGTGSQTLNGSSTFDGTVAINAGTLIAASNNAFSGAPTTVASGATWGLQGTITQNGSVTGTIAGAGAAGRAGAIDNISGNNAISGALTLSAAATVGTTAGNLTVSGATLTLGANALTTAPTTGTSVTISGVIGGTGSVTQNGAGTLILSGANTYTGGTTVSAGTLQGTTTSLQGNIVDNATLAFSQSTNGTYAGVISGTGALLKSGTGTLTLSGTNTYTGGTTITGGLVSFATLANLGSGAITLNGGGVQWGTGATADVSAQLAAIGASGGTFDTNGNNVTLASVLSGSGPITKTGAGTLTLSAANTYIGSTSVFGGTLRVTGSIAPVSTVLIQTGTTVTGTGSVGDLRLGDNATLVPGNGGIGTLSSAILAWNGSTTGAATAFFELSNSDTTSDRVAVSGAFTKGTGSTFKFDFGGTGAAGNSYTLATFGSTTFAASDFSFTNLAPGLGGSFSIVGGNTLVFSAAVAPVINSPTVASGTYRNAFSYSITATGTAPSSYSVTGALPAGVTLNTSTGVISGTPTAIGTFNVTLRATNAAGFDDESLAITIGPATVNPVFTANNKTFDGTTIATIATRSLTGVLGGDNVTLTGGTATFASASIGTAQTVTATGFTLGGTAAGNYQLSSTSATTTANITGAVVAPVITAANKVYDGTTSTTILTRSLTGVLPADVGNVTLTGGTAAFASATAGTGKTVTGTGFTLTGSAAGNYQLSPTSATTTADITAANLTIDVTNLSFVYDGSPKTPTVTVSPAGVGVAVTYIGLAAAPFNAGEYLLSVRSTDANYSGALSRFFTIAKAPAQVTLSNLTQTTTGTARNATATTVPAGLAVRFTYNGSTTAPSAAGTYAVVATIDDPNYAGSATGTLTLTGTAPTITQQPASRSVTSGANVALSVTANSNGGGTLRYQWRFNGEPLAGATAATLTLDAVRIAQAGVYTVVVSNDAASVTSSPATLAVQPGNYAGVYFGTLGGTQGQFALTIRPDGTGTLLLYVVSTRTGYTVLLTIDGDGAFTGVAIPLVRINAAATIGDRVVAAADGDPLVTGRVVNGVIAGTTGSLGLPMAVPVAVGPFPITGSFTASTTGTAPTTINAVVGASGQAFVLVTSGGVTTVGTGTVASGGAFSIATTDGPSITGTLGTDGSVAGTVTRGNVTTPFLGAMDGAGAIRRLGNLATRGFGGAGDNVMIAGFVIGGTAPKQVLIRGVGPGLAQFGVSGFLAQPSLELLQGTTRVAQNTGWSTAANAADIAAVAAANGAFPLGAGSADSAILTMLPPGSYTAVVRGVNNSTGVSLVEVYEVGSPDGSRLVNLATRGSVSAGANQLIAGLFVSGNAPKQVLVRAVGLTLASFGVAGPLADPQLQIMQGTTVVATNDNWGGDAGVAAAAVQAGAFALPAGSRDAAVLVTLAPGAYTVVVSGVGNAAGVALVEVYELP